MTFTGPWSGRRARADARSRWRAQRARWRNFETRERGIAESPGPVRLLGYANEGVDRCLVYELLCGKGTRPSLHGILASEDARARSGP